MANEELKCPVCSIRNIKDELAMKQHVAWVHFQATEPHYTRSNNITWPIGGPKKKCRCLCGFHGKRKRVAGHILRDYDAHYAMWLMGKRP